MTEAKPGRGSDQFPLRLPDGMRDALKIAADENGRSMNAEIVSRLQQSFDVRSMARAVVLDEAIKSLQQSAKDMAHQTAVLKWMHEQQSVAIHLLETIAGTDGHLTSEFMTTLRGMLGRRGTDAGFPEQAGESRDS